ncbi:MAG TPA: class I SAM-dependent DNA methyltransferase [Puia sp.]|nr:class I SAM-dependent DNA methyltransferase [Puia sp.]
MAKASQKKEDQQPLEKTLWLTADKLRKNLDASEYKHIVLGLIFLKYISDAFDDLYQKLLKGEGNYAGADPEDPDEYRAENVFFVPQDARWSYLLSRAKLPTIGVDIDSAMDSIEKENPQLRGVLTKEFAKPKLDKRSLGELLDMVGSIDLGSAAAQSKDLLGRVFEYFLGQFALAEGKKGGQFYTPRSVVQLLVEMLEPYKGRVFDPCCGSGGMFVQSEKFVLAHQGRIDDISIYGQESNQTTWRLCVMNLAIRGIDSSNVKWNNEGSFLRDAHPDLKADFIIANPPFNVSDWSGELLQTDGRWRYGTPPPGNANFAWIQHFLHHLSPKGRSGVVLSKGSLTSKQSNEGEIRKNLIDAGLIDCIVNLPTKLFLNTQIPACLWFLNRDLNRPRKGHILFIDARNLGFLVTRRTRDLSPQDLAKVAETYHNWVKGNGGYQDIPGFCKSVPLDDVKNLDYVLTPGRYIGLSDDEDDFDFNERFSKLKDELDAQMKAEVELNERIRLNLSRIKEAGNA